MFLSIVSVRLLHPLTTSNCTLRNSHPSNCMRCLELMETVTFCLFIRAVEIVFNASVKSATISWLIFNTSNCCGASAIRNVEIFVQKWYQFLSLPTDELINFKFSTFFICSKHNQPPFNDIFSCVNVFFPYFNHFQPFVYRKKNY